MKGRKNTTQTFFYIDELREEQTPGSGGGQYTILPILPKTCMKLRKFWSVERGCPYGSATFCYQKLDESENNEPGVSLPGPSRRSATAWGDVCFPVGA